MHTPVTVVYPDSPDRAKSEARNAHFWPRFWLWPIFPATYRPFGCPYRGALPAKIGFTYRLLPKKIFIPELQLDQKLVWGGEWTKFLMSVQNFFIFTSI